MDGEGDAVTRRPASSPHQWDWQQGNLVYGRNQTAGHEDSCWMRMKVAHSRSRDQEDERRNEARSLTWVRRLAHEGDSRLGPERIRIRIEKGNVSTGTRQQQQETSCCFRSSATAPCDDTRRERTIRESRGVSHIVAGSQVREEDERLTSHALDSDADCGSAQLCFQRPRRDSTDHFVDPLISATAKIT